ncbi:MAG TPA: FAD-binding and (Fe-S)-binding domain-containing protein [Gemmatimonadales bacterium]|nr:FAD-binding and (Fe-S)-binding domain-containing protein [Gemmatimonadales bacterium]
MATTLTELRALREQPRFARLRRDDATTAIPAPDARALERALRERLRGEVRFDAASRALYATDGSNYRQVPIGVVVPRDLDDVIHAVACAREHGAPLLARGGGTSLAGQCCNVALVLDFTKYMHHVLAIDVEHRLARVEPGCVLDDLRNAARAHGLTFGPDPATHTHNTLGGMLGNNSCGSHSLLCRKEGRGLRTSDNTHALSVLTYDGLGLRVGETPEHELEAIIRGGGPRGAIYAALKQLRDRYADRIRTGFPKLPRRVSGYNLDELLPENGFHVARALVGTECTCAVTLEATLHLVEAPKARSLVVYGYPDIYHAADHLETILEFEPTALEGLDHLLFEWVKARGREEAAIELLPPGYGFLMVEFGGESKADADAQAERCMAALERGGHPPSMKSFDDPREEELLWKVREGGLGSTAWVPGHPDTWPGWEDSAVPVDKVADYLHDLKDLMHRHGYDPSLYGHFGQGCIHCRIGFDLYTAEGIRNWRSFMDQATDLVVRYGGSLSGEHGDGQARAEYLPKMFGADLVQAFREFKAIWDPQGKMNPGKVVDPYPITDNLRISPDYNPPDPPVHFHYPDDRHSFARAALRCVGVGECRREGGQTMCPSYMATREEMHSTRGRARLLWEMVNGEILDRGWRSPAVKEALDLCLSCKGCKHDCPVSVDMATYKAEFLSHYWAGRLRPRHAFAFGWIHYWARLASAAPAVANLFSQAPLLRDAAKLVAGAARQRSLPPFAPRSFTRWYRARGARRPTGPPVLLWPDTFNNYFHPETAQAAVEVLEDAGYRVLIPRGDFCCGRPLYDYGFLDMARRWLGQILTGLQREIEAGVPVVVLEPSCGAVFRDELTNLFPNVEDAHRLQRQTFLLSEFLERKASHYRLPKLPRKALMHGHCHHKSVMGLDAERAVLGRMGLDVDAPEDGCCGMAGAFGFEPGDHYEVSLTCGERVLLPAVRQATDETLVIANGFSCREQIRQETDRYALHLAQVLQLARRAGETSADAPAGGGRPEAPVLRRVRAERRAANRRAALTAGTLAAGVGAAWWWAQRER